MTPPNTVASLGSALPFWMSLGLIPVLMVAANYGGWTLLLPIVFTFGLFAILDAVGGLNLDNADPDTPDAQLFWYRLITLIWFPIQFLMIFAMIWYATRATHLGALEKIGLFYGVGQVTGAVGIVYAHELIHQKNNLERWLGDLLLGTVMYGHFRTEHLMIHHRYVGTPRDAVTARYNESYYRFLPRVLIQSWISAVHVEHRQLAKTGLAWWDARNPFWRYYGLQISFMTLAVLLGGWAGLGLFLFQAFVAIAYLELTDYVEHYGLTRKHLGDGKYEPTMPHHSWNASHRASNWLLINLQRHSDHHYKPGRRFPLLQNHTDSDAPQLPYGYPVMIAAALLPPIWRRRMNPRVRAWRAKYYPEITDWTPYRYATNPVA